MSTFKVDTINNDGTNAIDATNGFTIAGNSIVQGYTSSASEPSSPSTGDLWWDSTNGVLKRYINSEWKELSFAVNDNNGWSGDRAVIGGGGGSIVYYDIATTGNASTFGSLTVSRDVMSAVSNQTRAVWGGGSSTTYTEIDYVTIATTGNATDFGDMFEGMKQNGAVSDGTYGVFGAGRNASGQYPLTMQYITIATTGNASDFGDADFAIYLYYGGMSNGTRGVFASGNQNQRTLTYITIATTGNATAFGFDDASSQTADDRRGTGSCSDATRGVMGGGQNNALTDITYITIDTTGDSTDFGDLSQGRRDIGATANATYATFNGGSSTNKIDYITIQTTGNATDFGDLTATNNWTGATSGSAS